MTLLDMNLNYDSAQSFDYENGFYLTSSASRMGRAISHYELYKRIQSLPGDIVECGVFKGVSLMRFISFVQLFEAANPRRVIGFDTFGSFPGTNFQPDQAELEEFIRETGGGFPSLRKNWRATSGAKASVRRSWSKAIS